MVERIGAICQQVFGCTDNPDQRINPDSSICCIRRKVKDRSKRSVRQKLLSYRPGYSKYVSVNIIWKNDENYLQPRGPSNGVRASDSSVTVLVDVAPGLSCRNRTNQVILSA